MLTPRIRSILLGSLLGDGALAMSRTSVNPYFVFTQTIKRFWYRPLRGIYVRRVVITLPEVAYTRWFYPTRCDIMFYTDSHSKLTMFTSLV